MCVSWCVVVLAPLSVQTCDVVGHDQEHDMSSDIKDDKFQIARLLSIIVCGSIAIRAMDNKHSTELTSTNLSSSKIFSMCARVLCLTVLASMIMAGTSCRELYVRPTSDLTSDCPGVPCLTLQKYVEMSDMFITSNIVLKLLPGQHIITDTFIVQDIQNVAIEGQTCTDTETSTYPIIEYSVKNYSIAKPVLHFKNSFNISVIGVKFEYKIASRNQRERVYENTSIVKFEHVSDVTIIQASISAEMESFSSQPPFISGFGMEIANSVHLKNVEITGVDMGIITHNSTNVILTGVKVSNSSTAISIIDTDNVMCNDVYIIESNHTDFEISNSNYIALQNLTIQNLIKFTHLHGFRYYIHTHKSSHISILDSVIETTINYENRIRMLYSDFIYISNITVRNRLFRIDLYYTQNVKITDSEIGGIDTYSTDNLTVSHTSLLRPYEGFFARYISYTYLHYMRSSEIHMNFASHQEILHTTIIRRGIGIYNANDTIISNTTVSNSRSEGVVLFNSHHTTISNVILSNTRDPGIHIINSDFTTVIHTSVSHSTQAGVRLEGAGHTTLSDITVSNAGVHGIVLLDTVHTGIFNVSVENSNSNGIEIHNGTNTTISHVLVENSGLNGMELSHINHTTISQTGVRNANWNGIQLRDSENTDISFTTVSYAQWIGIELCYSTLTNIFNTTVTGYYYRPNYHVTRECFKQCSYDPTLEVTCKY